MEFLIISGLSGAGKSQAADVLEDLDFYCVDNMPAALIPRFAELVLGTRSRYARVALVTDIREQGGFDDLFTALDELWTIGVDYHILFMEADITTIVNRYKETRRRHPLAQEGMSIETAVERESALLEQVRERADYVINTTGKNIAALQNELYTLFVSDSVKRPLSVNVISFGFKHGIPIESDMVFDVRFLPNPFYVSELRSLTGLDKPVSDYVFSFGDAAEFLRKLKEMMRFLLPLFVEEGKHSLTVAVGCTGGKHRSVAIAAALTDAIADLGYGAQLINRDISKG